MTTTTLLSDVDHMAAATQVAPMLFAVLALTLLLALIIGVVLTIWIGELSQNLHARLPAMRTNTSSLRINPLGPPRSGLTLVDVVLRAPEREERHYRLLPFAMLNVLTLLFLGIANTVIPVPTAVGWRSHAAVVLALALMAWITARGAILLGSTNREAAGVQTRTANGRPTGSGFSTTGVIGFAVALTSIGWSVATLHFSEALVLLLRAATVMPLVAGVAVAILSTSLFVSAHGQYAFDRQAQHILRRGARALALPFIAVEAGVWCVGERWLAGGGIGTAHWAWLSAGSWLALGSAYVLCTWAHRANNYLAAVAGARGVPIVDNVPGERQRLRGRILHLDSSGLLETARRQPVLSCIVVAQIAIGAAHALGLVSAFRALALP